MIPNVVIRAGTIVLIVTLVTTPASAVASADTFERQSLPDRNTDFGGAQSDEHCGTIDGLTVSDLVLSVEIANGTVENLDVDDKETNATVRNGSLLFDQGQISVNRAAFDDENIELPSDMFTVVSGGFFLQNATATVDGENVSLNNRRLTVDDNAASDAGITVGGVDRIPRAPAQFLDNSSMDTLTLSEISGDLRFESASREVLGVAVLQMETVELSESPLNPSFEEVTVSDGEVTANGVSVPVENGDISIGELAISSQGTTFRSTDVDGDIEDDTVEFDDPLLEQPQLNALLESC